MEVEIMAVKRIVTLVASLCLIFGGIIAPVRAHSESSETLVSSCDDGRPGDTYLW